MTSTTPNASPDPARQTLYFNLIDELLQCPGGQEPQVLDAHAELLDEGLVRSLIQVATFFAHENNAEAAQFLIHVARELAKQLGFYPDVSSSASASSTESAVS